MNTETMITELKAVAEKHKNDFVPTFQTNISSMCRDIIPKLERLEEYEKIGTIEEIKEILQIISEGQDDVDESGISTGLFHALLEYAEYKKIGKVEECREAREKQRTKKPRFYAHNYYCGNCGNLVGNDEFKWKRFMYCDKCGHAVLWERDDE